MSDMDDFFKLSPWGEEDNWWWGNSWWVDYSSFINTTPSQPQQTQPQNQQFNQPTWEQQPQVQQNPNWDNSAFNVWWIVSWWEQTFGTSNYNSSSSKNAYKLAFSWWVQAWTYNGTETSDTTIKTPDRWFFGTLSYFWEINKNVYSNFNPIQLWLIVVAMWLAAYLLWLLKESVVYLILYNAHLLDFFGGMESLMILLVYILIVYWIFEILDWVNDKWRANLQLPFKMCLIFAWLGYLSNTLSFDQLFDLFYYCLIPFVFIRLFCFSEEDMVKWQVSNNDNQIQENVSTQWQQQNTVNTIIDQWADAFKLDIADEPMKDLVAQESDDEVETYDLGTELIAANKDKNASCFLMSEKLKLYYFDIEEAPEVQ